MKFQNFSYNAHYVNKTSSTKSIRIFSRVTVHTSTNVHSSRLHRVTRTRLCVALVKSLKKNYRKNRTLCPSAVEKSERKSHENGRTKEISKESIFVVSSWHSISGSLAAIRHSYNSSQELVAKPSFSIISESLWRDIRAQ